MAGTEGVDSRQSDRVVGLRVGSARFHPPPPQVQAEALQLAGQMEATSLELHQLIAASESEQEAQLPLMEHAEAS